MSTQATQDAPAVLPYRCQSRECQADMAERQDLSRVMFLTEGEACSTCRSRKYLHPLAIVHLLLPCGEDDPAGLQGRNGKWKIACGATIKDAKRLATERDVCDGDGYFSAPIVTCAACRETTKNQQPPERPGIQI